ncbi:MAG: tRNA (adenosine(37)-N6)-dimethylallyltransferase MiaA [Bacteroidales bacterium]|nr:tRNA (adenosine(37)-N6)-dimethylallyltransferase MiaA [Bacteroidales bacterium]
MSSPLLLTITGPTACGKTVLAAETAYLLNGEVLSADSRQVFRGMDIGTGKDLQDYVRHGVSIPYHLIDICEAGTEYNVYRFMNDFATAFDGILQRRHQPILCGGTGLYIEAIVRGYHLSNAPEDANYRRKMEHLSDEELTQRLASLVKLHNHTDTEDRKRLLRALEIEEFRRRNPEDYVQLPPMRHVVVALATPREMVIDRIGRRLRQRIEEGMVEEVEQLLASGIEPSRLLRYGLEYKHVTRYLMGECTLDDMERDLFTDIRRFAKRQMTWFRRMERNGVPIHWIDGREPLAQQTSQVIACLEMAEKQ